MAVSILEALMNAKYNICDSNTGFQLQIGKEQLKNAVTLLEKGYSLEDEVETVLSGYEDVEDVPEKQDQ